MPVCEFQHSVFLPWADVKFGKIDSFNCRMQELFTKPLPAGLNNSVGMLTAGTIPIISTGFTLIMADPSYEIKNDI